MARRARLRVAHRRLLQPGQRRATQTQEQFALRVAAEEDVARFLKENFLVTSGRYFVFSSHVATTADTLKSFFAWPSDRRVHVQRLPLIHALAPAARQLGCPALSAHEAVFLGRIPALVYENSQRGLDVGKVEGLMSQLSAEQIRDEDLCRGIMRSVFVGTKHLIPQPLHSLLDTYDDTVRWIPLYLQAVLRFLARQGPPRFHTVLNSVCDLLLQFRGAKVQGRDTWEALFVVALLLRVLCLDYDAVLMPFPVVASADVAFSYNTQAKPFARTKKVSDLLALVVRPSVLPHVAVFYPPHATFADVDVVVVTWGADGDRYEYGYQLKEGERSPSRPAPPLDNCFWVRGSPPARPHPRPDGWQVMGQEQLDSYFGVSGEHWTPAAWKELTG
jgi:hypothetical protein